MPPAPRALPARRRKPLQLTCIVTFMLCSMLAKPSITATVAATAADSAGDAGAMRSLWMQDDARFLRSWLLLGPRPGNLADGLGIAATAIASAGLSQELADGQSLTWQPQSSWTDAVDLSTLLSAPAYRGSNAQPEIAYVYTTIRREQAGSALLSIASEVPYQAWVNGKLVDVVAARRAFLFDQDRMPVHFEAGDNHLLIEFEHRSGPWRFAVRTLRQGQIVPPHDEITPAFSAEHSADLGIVTDITPNNPGAPVHAAVTAAGGHIVAQSNAERGATVQFATASWPDGPYEIRLTTKTAWGANAVVHLPWYKGDARLAAQGLVEAAQKVPTETSGATLHMLADLVRDRLGNSPMSAPDDAWPLIHSALMEYAELQQRAAGNPGPVRAYGFVRLAYMDDIDGSAQFCRAYLPANYTATQRWPLIVTLHGFNPENPPYVRWWNVAKRHDATADSHDVIVLEPLGRGNSQYRGIGEEDVLHCLEQAKGQLSVADDRVYLTGESMGGSGTWLIASHHPELFAAAAPVFGGFDYRIIPGAGFDNPHADQLPERFLRESQSSFGGAEGLLNLPMLVTHGDSDQTVPVEFSRLAVNMLQRWNYDLRYQEIPGRGHEDLDMQDNIATWLLEHQRANAPREVRIRSVDLDGAGAYWAKVIAFQEPLQVIDVNAQVLRPGLIRLDTRNVAAIRLTLPKELRGSTTVQVTWNGRSISVTPDTDGSILLQTLEEKLAPGDKRPGLQGGLSDVITTAFAIVIGTASRDPGMRELCREKAEAFADRWFAWQHVRPRLFRDDQLTAAEESRYSLVLIGGADANLVTRKLAARLPLRVDSHSVTIDGRRIATRDAVVEMIYPSPIQPARYVMVVAATSTDGMHFWAPEGLWQMPLGYPTNALDWTIRDGRVVALENGLGTQRSAVAAGVFNGHWRMEDRYVFRGDAALRAASPLRTPPRHTLTPSPSLIHAYSGRYQLQPGVVLSVFAKGNDLAIDAGGMSYVLKEETDNMFAVGATASVAIFSRNSQGHTTGLTINDLGSQVFATRIE